MIPVIVEDLINKLLNKKDHLEKRQFYFITLKNIETKISEALKEYEREKHFRK